MSKQVESIAQLRSMPAEEIDEHVAEQRRKLFEVRFQQSAGQVDNHRQIRELRREIARSLTIAGEIRRGVKITPPVVAPKAKAAPPKKSPAAKTEAKEESKPKAAAKKKVDENE